MFDSKWFFGAVVAFLTWLVTSIVGCSIVDTGPIITKTIAENSTGVIKQALSQYQPDAMSLDANGHINDPRYYMKMFVGTGVYVDILLGVNGIDTEVVFNSDGRGIPVSPEVTAEARRIMGNTLMTDAEKQKALQSVFTQWLRTLSAPAVVEMTDTSGDNATSDGTKKEGDAQSAPLVLN